MFKPIPVKKLITDILNLSDQEIPFLLLYPINIEKFISGLGLCFTVIMRIHYLLPLHIKNQYWTLLTCYIRYLSNNKWFIYSWYWTYSILCSNYLISAQAYSCGVILVVSLAGILIVVRCLCRVHSTVDKIQKNMTPAKENLPNRQPTNDYCTLQQVYLDMNDIERNGTLH